MLLFALEVRRRRKGDRLGDDPGDGGTFGWDGGQARILLAPEARFGDGQNAQEHVSTGAATTSDSIVLFCTGTRNTTEYECSQIM